MLLDPHIRYWMRHFCKSSVLNIENHPFRLDNLNNCQILFTLFINIFITKLGANSVKYDIASVSLLIHQWTTAAPKSKSGIQSFSQTSTSNGIETRIQISRQTVKITVASASSLWGTWGGIGCFWNSEIAVGTISVIDSNGEPSGTTRLKTASGL